MNPEGPIDQIDEAKNPVPEEVRLDDVSTSELPREEQIQEEGPKYVPVLNEEGFPELTEDDIHAASELGFGTLRDTKMAVAMVIESLRRTKDTPECEEYQNGFEFLSNLQAGARNEKEIKKNLFLICNVDVVRLLRTIAIGEDEKDKKLTISPVSVLLERGIKRITNGYGLVTFFDAEDYLKYAMNRYNRSKMTIDAMNKIQSSFSKFSSEIFRAINLYPHALLRSFLKLYEGAKLYELFENSVRTQTLNVKEMAPKVREAIADFVIGKTLDKTYLKPFVDDLLSDDVILEEFVGCIEIHDSMYQTQKIIRALADPSISSAYDDLCDATMAQLKGKKKFSKIASTFLTDGFTKDYRDPESVVALHMTNIIPSEFFIHLDHHEDLTPSEQATYFRLFNNIFAPRFFDNILNRTPDKNEVKKVLGDEFVSEVVYQYIVTEFNHRKESQFSILKNLVSFRHTVISILGAEASAVAVRRG